MSNVHTHGKTSSTLLQNSLPTPHWGFQPSGFTVQAITKSIQATPQQVLDTLVDTTQYRQWNNFVPKIVIRGTTIHSNRPDTITLYHNAVFTEHIDMFGHGKPSGLVKVNLKVIILGPWDPSDTSVSRQAGVQMVWLNTLVPTWLLRSERVHRIYEGRDSDGTTYECFETFSGALAWLTRVCVGAALIKRFAQWNEECRIWMERSN